MSEKCYMVIYNFTLIWPVLENKTVGGPEVTPVIELLKQWTPEDIQHLSFPASIGEWQADFSWGPWLAQHVFQVMQQVKRPTEPQGPLRAEVGVSWLELAIAFSLAIKRALPILREYGVMQLIMIEDSAD